MTPTHLLHVLPAAIPDDTGGVVADFSEETWWLTIVKAVGVVALLRLAVSGAGWGERRGVARLPARAGPNVNGPFGFFQAIADAGAVGSLVSHLFPPGRCRRSRGRQPASQR